MKEHSRIIEQNGIFELEAGKDLNASKLYNSDIAPTRFSERTWQTRHFAFLWIGIAVCVPTYTVGGVLTTYFGLSVTEAILTVCLANILVLVPLCLNAFPGTKYGIPFPVLARSSFGTMGSNLPCLVRAIIACGWFGIQTLFGGLAVHLLFSSLSNQWASLGSVGEVFGFFLFMVLNLAIVIRGSNAIKTLETLSAPLLLAVAIGLIFWALPKVDLDAILSEPPGRPEGTSVWPYFFSGLTAMVGFWATISLNISDFSRFARSQKDQILGQILGLPLTMCLFASLGVIMTAASPDLVGESISDPIHLIGKIDQPFMVALSMLVIIIATVSTNTAANIVSPTNDFQNLAPRWINQTRGVLLTGMIGLSLVAWELLKKLGLLDTQLSVETLFSSWLLGYSSLIGPIAGIMVVDYFLIKRQRLNLIDLYSIEGKYPVVNRWGVLAFLIPATLATLSLMTGTLTWINDYSWFVGTALGGGLYYTFNRLRPDTQSSTVSSPQL